MFLFCDNKSAFQMLQNSTHHEHTKYVNIDCHFAKHHLATCFLKPYYIEFHLQVTDVFTKVLGPSLFYSLIFKFNMKCPHVKFEGGVLKELNYVGTEKL